MERFIGPLIGAIILAIGFWGATPREQRVQPAPAPVAPVGPTLEQAREQASRAIDDARQRAWIEALHEKVWADHPSQGGKDQ